jgi:dTDP-4-amino-4,6-dideoxygalactose transaminase
MKIPFGLPIINHKEKKLVLKTLDSPILVHGNNMKNFENKLIICFQTITDFFHLKVKLTPKHLTRF